LRQSSPNSEVRETIRKISLANAIAHEGKAQTKPVLSKLLSEKPELKRRIREIARLVSEVVKEVNNLSLGEQTKTVQEYWPELLVQERKKIVEKKGLPPLPNADRYGQIVTRFAPNPDAVLHIGSARPVTLCYEYAKMYNGKFVLRFEDTDPRLKRSTLEFYDLIRKDLEWLGCEWDEEYIQSDRIEIYYKYAERLLKAGRLYICTCKREEFRERVWNQEACPCRGLSSEENLARWEDMLTGDYDEGEAVMRIKTVLDHPNPAVRDWPAFRIIDPRKYPHPRVGSKYRVWPLFNFANGVDDHLIGVTHIIRGKEHRTNQTRQEYLYRYLGWTYPEAIHFGRLKIPGATLSKSKMARGVEAGTFQGWDDPRLATFLALKRRGMQPEALRQLMIDIGPRPADITVSWKNLYAYNRKIIDPVANRYFFVQEPKRLRVKPVHKDFAAHIPLHPDFPERGARTLEVRRVKDEAYLLISNEDAALTKEGAFIRLMDLFNVQIEAVDEREVVARFLSEPYEEARRLGAPLIHWLPRGGGVSCDVVMPDGSVVSGLAEKALGGVSADQIIQFERFGFVRVDEVGGKIVVFFAHK